MSISSIIAKNNPFEGFVQQLVQLESRNKIQLQQQQAAQRERKTALTDVNNAVKKFTENLEALRKEDGPNPFSPFSNSVSNDKAVRINSVNNFNNAASFNLNVERLATKDIALTQVMNREGNELATTGEGSVTITIGDVTETITIDTTDKTNAEVLEALAASINETFGEQAGASLFNVNSDEIQFSMKSNESGFENRIQFDGFTGDLAALDITKLAPENELDARFTIDGVTFTRGSNQVDDAINGLSFTMLRASEDTVTMDITRDIEGARKKVDEFISSFNNVNRTIRDRTFLDAENDRRGPLQNMRVVRNLTVNLRQIGILPDGAAGEGDISRLSDIGIEFERNGTMKVGDSAKLNEFLESNPDALQRFFTSEDSPITAMLNEAKSYTEPKTGLIATLTDGVDQRIDNLGRRISQQDRFLAQYEERQRAEFAKLQMIIDQGQQQFAEIMAFQGQFMGGRF
ncbi:MAG: flagellar filament capping protein FliD [Bacteroidetes bacterium]|nr:flagellar filament capping protein FliD [Bacteroidota bacterium]MCH8524216.1 flagellar filament capping protein FliD [Balneolales bacterium]